MGEKWVPYIRDKIKINHFAQHFAEPFGSVPSGGRRWHREVHGAKAGSTNRKLCRILFTNMDSTVWTDSKAGSATGLCGPLLEPHCPYLGVKDSKAISQGCDDKVSYVFSIVPLIYQRAESGSYYFYYISRVWGSLSSEIQGIMTQDCSQLACLGLKHFLEGGWQKLFQRMISVTMT